MQFWKEKAGTFELGLSEMNPECLHQLSVSLIFHLAEVTDH